MKRDRIIELLNKYWNCETNLAEEQELRRLFTEEELTEELQHYAPLFSYIEEEQAPRLSAGFEQRLRESLRKAKIPAIPQHMPRRTRVMRIAASILLLLGTGVSLYFITRQQNNPQYAEKGVEETEVLEQATDALEKLADALRLSEEASRETLRQLNEMEIDWEMIDSLNRVTAPGETDPDVETDDAAKGSPSGDTIQEGATRGYPESINGEEKI
jgi:hypothetical protein